MMRPQGRRHAGIRIREARSIDSTRLVDLIREHAAFERAQMPTVSAEALDAALSGRDPPLLAWVAEHAEGVVGYLTATRDFSTWQGRRFLHMDCLYVRPGLRNAGVGTRLMDVLRRHAEGIGVCEIQWQTPDWNEEAARFYRRQGAKESLKRRFSLAIRVGGG